MLPNTLTATSSLYADTCFALSRNALAFSHHLGHKQSSRRIPLMRPFAVTL